MPRGEGVRVVRLSSRANTPSMAQVMLASDTSMRTHREPVQVVCRALLRAVADIQADPEAAATDLMAFLARGDAPLQAPRVLARRMRRGWIWCSASMSMPASSAAARRSLPSAATNCPAEPGRIFYRHAALSRAMPA